ncbi:hypothetical protein TUBRATIS_12830 [Tubulinosema ratisbonensis]|uniref:Uncharacterized protein n=1 Tax=Tubulinosema ratisbonensis TaxID=291195 RepID=A0A437AM50_9MICR|nr:hypothetical protein TUBRATIS_12830 [Tubulinosema ratisbonensis]
MYRFLKWVGVAALGLLVWGSSMFFYTYEVDTKEMNDSALPLKQEPITDTVEKFDTIHQLEAELAQQINAIRQKQTNKVIKTNSYQALVNLVSSDSVPVIINLTFSKHYISDPNLFNYLQTTGGLLDTQQEPQKGMYKGKYFISKFKHGKVLDVLLSVPDASDEYHKNIRDLEFYLFNILYDVIKEFQEEQEDQVTFILTLNQFDLNAFRNFEVNGTKISAGECKLRYQKGVCSVILTDYLQAVFILNIIGMDFMQI